MIEAFIVCDRPDGGAPKMLEKAASREECPYSPGRDPLGLEPLL